MCVHVACYSGSVLLWRRCDMLCTSGFVDDVTFSHNDHMAHNVHSLAALELDKHNSRDSNQILLSDKASKDSS